MRLKIRKGDTVEVISGRLEDKGKRGEVITVMVMPTRVVVQGVNIRTKHQRQMQTQAGRQIKPFSSRLPWISLTSCWSARSVERQPA
jgi:large subunit ribosomal protein L24